MSAETKIILNLQKLSLNINLGLTEEERKLEQVINIYLKFYFLGTPKACFSDEIEDTLCYNHLTKLIKNYCHNKQFKLIEKMAYELFQLLRNNIDPSIKIWLKLRKPNPFRDESLESSQIEITDYP